ncbi:MAG TPA: choice-of-anchor tandem repeat NxxGxxAF-containing protein [Phycisphaerales bacterium]|nr:choice-of-anchor tandem repeat NxxGxxAF-containing protein [Phycisphaerales bacterium]
MNKAACCLAASVALMVVGVASGQLTTQTMASTVSTCTAPKQLTWVGYPHVNLGGDVVFIGQTCDPAYNGVYVASTSSGSLTRNLYVAQSTSPTSGFQWFRDYPAINDSSTVAFKGARISGSTLVEGVYTATATTWTKVAETSSTGFESFDNGIPDGRVRINAVGQVLFGARLHPDGGHPFSTNSLWVHTPPSTLTQVCREGDAIDGGTLVSVMAWDFNKNGTIVMFGQYDDGMYTYAGVWRGTSAGLSLVLSTPVPDWGYFPGVFVNHQGDFAIECNAHVGVGMRDEWNIQTAPPMSRITMAAGGMTAPGTGGLQFIVSCPVTGNILRSINPPSINFGRQGIFHSLAASTNCTGYADTDGFWYWDGTTLSAEAVRGQNTSSWTGGSALETFADSTTFAPTVAINDATYSAFLANVTTNSVNGTALFARAGTSKYRVAGYYNGEELWFGQGTTNTALVGNDNLNSGYGRLSNCGYLVYRVSGATTQTIERPRLGLYCVIPFDGIPEE